MKFNIINGLPNSGKTEKMINFYVDYKKNDKKCVAILNKILYDKDLAMDKWYSKNKNVCTDYDYLIDDENITNVLNSNDTIDYLFLDESYSYSLTTLEKLFNFLREKDTIVYVANFTNNQIDYLNVNNISYDLETLYVKCASCDKNSVVLCPDFTNYITETYCQTCYCDKVNEVVNDIKKKLSSYPLMPAGEIYQPFLKKDNNFFFDLSNTFKDYKVLRNDTDNRINIYLKHHTKEIKSYIDLGCNTGYFCDYMSDILNIPNVYGIDICSTLHDICVKKSKYILLNNNKYICSNLYDYFINTEKTFDVISAYSVIQWVMIQKGDEYGVILLKKLALITDKILILEIGDYKEHHYDKLKILIGTDWLIELLKEYFKEYVVYDKNTYSLKRDIVYFIK
jgi:SAM-dependent methyltransferase